MPKYTDLEIAYIIDLLTRLSESAEGYLDDDRSGTEYLEAEIKEAKKVYRKYYRNLRKEAANAN